MYAYKAYFEGGQVIPVGNPAIPEGSELIITILESPAKTFTIAKNTTLDNVGHRQMEAMRRFCEENRNCDEPMPEFERIKFREVEI
jgi:hypothetical protein